METESKKLKYIERNINRHESVRYYFRHPLIGRIRLPDPYSDHDHFLPIYKKCLRQLKAEQQRVFGKPEKKRRARPFPLNPFPQYASYCKQRAQRKGIPFHLSAHWFRKTLEKQEGKRAVSGIPMTLKADKGPKSPYQVSVDRIDHNRGYEPSNCRLVILAVNLAMNTWGEKVFREIATRTVQEQTAATPPKGSGSNLPHLDYFAE
ncbi:hypothetical protein J5N58_06710 [Rhizobium cremeum]|uniref:hypothetical protein n=1 Tax=Rhizobium cremeum TaxID=2813827 RepID=UPI001FD1D363|nr:hypothetical protein [Rhizobium cremeum]MCJ7996641.1 hypothetical protein [Rhizobium cremeum]MCJ7999365.1 hypothetical protein [Rhizobium cremeum]